MRTQYTQGQFRTFLSDSLVAIMAVQREVAEIQSGFNSRYLELKADHDTALTRLTKEVLQERDKLPAALVQLISEQLTKERAALQERRERLQTQVPELQQEVDQLLLTGQERLAELRGVNPEFDTREEEMKTKVAQHEGTIAALDNQITELRSGLGFVWNYRKIDEADKERQRFQGKIDTLREEIEKVRNAWQKRLQFAEEQEAELKEEWQAKSLELANLRADQQYLADDARLESLALQRAAFHVLDHLKDPARCTGELADKLRLMLVLNHQTDNYTEGLRAVAGLIALLGSVAEGMESLVQTTDTLIGQQRQHSAHLRPLQLHVSDEVIAFHQQWEALRAAVENDARLCEKPLEFLEVVQPTIEHNLTDEAIAAMFEDLGQTIKAATKGWKG